MSLKYEFSFTPADANLTGFASNVTGAAFTITTTATTDGLAHQVSIRNDSATDHSGKTVALVGTNANGIALTESVTGPAGAATVESTKYFKTLTSATPSATIGVDTFDIGWVDEFVSGAIMLDSASELNGALVQVDITGTINWTMQVTAGSRESFVALGDFPWIATTVSGLVGATADQIYNLAENAAVAMRFVANSYTDGATVKMYVSESAVGS